MAQSPAASLEPRHETGGNKRVAGVDTFLGMNGSYIDCASQEAYDHFMRLFETNSFRFAELREWLEGHVKPLPGA